VLETAGCVGLLGIRVGTSYAAMVVQFMALGGGLGPLVPPLTALLLGSVIGVALFGSLAASAGDLVHGLHEALWISVGLLLASAWLALSHTTER